MPEITFAPPHAIIFVYDPNNKSIVIPEYTPQRLTAANETCVSVGTLPYVDGEATVRLERDIESSDGELVFEGKILCPSKTMSINTSEKHSVLEIKTLTSIANVKIWANHKKLPDFVHVSVV